MRASKATHRVLTPMSPPKSSKPSGALFRRSLRNFAPVHALIEAINEICARVGSSTVRNDAPIRKRRVGR